jgi:basic amino acid/polyamine antiporter, APA family
MKPHALEKQLGLWDVYALATGATLSSGVFLLPGLAAAGAGAAMPLSYALAAAILLPGLMCHVELATAMPKAGGIYYFLDRSMGSLVGTVGGFGTWIALILKSSFALIGVGAYLRLFAPGLEMGPIAAALAVIFGVVNYFGTRKSGAFQGLLLVGLLILLAWFFGVALLQTEIGNYGGFFDAGSAGIISTAGLVVVSYMGLTKVVGVAEEVKNPGRNLPLGMFLALGTVVGIFVMGTSVMVGVVGVDTLAANGGDLAPVATVATRLVGPWGMIVMTVAAVLAFSSAANAGILSASRYPLAMGRDKLLPGVFSRIGGRGTPTVGIAVTVGLIVLSVTLIDPTKIAKLASAFKLLVFALACVAVIVMRESRIDAYDPEYRSPLYPWVHVIGILAPLWLIVRMGALPMLFTGALIALGGGWYHYYARSRSARAGAIFHVFERLGRETGTARRRDGDPLRSLCARARVMDLAGPMDFEELAARAATLLAADMPMRPEQLVEGFMAGTRMGATPISQGAALPHLMVDVVDRPFLVMARVREGVRLERAIDTRGSRVVEPTHAVFFLISPRGDPGRHLYLLSEFASRIGEENFLRDWLDAGSESALKEALFRGEDGLLVLDLRNGDGSRELVGLTVSEVSFPDDTLIATIRRGADLIVPGGDTALVDGDRVTVIGRPDAIRVLRERTREWRRG